MNGASNGGVSKMGLRDWIKIKTCAGCEEEWNIACELIEEGYHVATTIDRTFLKDKHISLIIVNDDGELILG